jgi:hypothetical protein
MANHGLGVGHGSMIDNGDGNIEYRQTGKLLPAFQINVGDVTGFSVRKPTKQDKKNGVSSLQRVLVIMGSGTELASVGVNVNTPGKIEAWIRAHPKFRGNVPQAAAVAAAPASSSLADELTKLAGLRDSGILSPEEFESAKARLLGS